ncbi:MAG: AarF/UbiB family protein, partial [Proteobacteria bacterium]|nr:AarF/UbiB family protein [Pseudomonadota bacterium]
MDIPQSKWARGSKLLKMASKIAAQELSHRLPGIVVDEARKLALRIDQTRELVATLSQMKGAAMKAGQLLGLEAGELLPPEVVEVLSKLQSEGQALGFDKIEAILKQELKEKYAELTDLTQKPIASASIGQVHQATYQGKDIVLKVQFPGIGDTIDSDVDMLSSLIDKFKFITNKKVDLTPLFDEIRSTLKQETDYLTELAFMQAYSENFHGLQGYVIPRPIAEISTKHVLAMEY